MASITDNLAALRPLATHHATVNGMRGGSFLADATGALGGLANASNALMVLVAAGFVDSEPVVVIKGDVYALYRVSATRCRPSTEIGKLQGLNMSSLTDNLAALRPLATQHATASGEQGEDDRCRRPPRWTDCCKQADWGKLNRKESKHDDSNY